jgi:hypothetical protein
MEIFAGQNIPQQEAWFLKSDLKTSLEFHMIYVSAKCNELFKLYLKVDATYSKQGRDTEDIARLTSD